MTVQRSIETKRGPIRAGCAVVVALAIGAGGGSGATALAAPADLTQYGRYLGLIENLESPAGVVIDQGDRIIVAESGAHRISIHDAQGKFLNHLSGPGVAPGRLMAPGPLALDADDNLFVLDAGNHRVQVFDAAGKLLRHWGERGREPGEFIEPVGLALDSDRVFVADAGTHRVEVFTHDGEYLMSVGEYGFDPGQFVRPIAIAGDGEGGVFVADEHRHIVQRFDHAGRFIDAFGAYGSFPGLLSHPRAIIRHEGYLHVLDSRNHRVQVMRPGGDAVYQWGSHALWLRDGEGRFETPTALAIAPDGTFVVVAEPLENRCQIIGPYVDEDPEVVPSVRERSHFGRRLRADGDVLVVPEPDRHVIGVYNLSLDVPILVGKFGSSGTAFGQMMHAPAVAVDAERSEVAVTDHALRRVQIFRLDRADRERLRFVSGMSRLVKSLDLAAVRGSTDTIAIEPDAIVRDAGGRLYLLDTSACRITVVTPELEFVTSWGVFGEDSGAFRRPTDLALNVTGDVLYVVDALNARIDTFSTEGTHLASFGDTGPRAARLVMPFGIALDPEGRVFVTDVATHQLKVYDRDGTFIEAWGERGDMEGQLYKPHGVAIDGRGRVLVSDYGNHRVQVFSPTGESAAMLGWRKPRVVPGANDD